MIIDNVISNIAELETQTVRLGGVLYLTDENAFLAADQESTSLESTLEIQHTKYEIGTMLSARLIGGAPYQFDVEIEGTLYRGTREPFQAGLAKVTNINVLLSSNLLYKVDIRYGDFHTPGGRPAEALIEAGLILRINGETRIDVISINPWQQEAHIILENYQGRVVHFEGILCLYRGTGKNREFCIVQDLASLDNLESGILIGDSIIHEPVFYIHPKWGGPKYLEPVEVTGILDAAETTPFRFVVGDLLSVITKESSRYIVKNVKLDSW